MGNSRAVVAGNPVVVEGNPSAAVEGIQVGVEGSRDCRQEEVPVAEHLLRAHCPL